MLDKRDNAAFVAEHLPLLGPFISQRDLQSLVQEGQLSQPLDQDIKAEFNGLKNLCIRFKRNLCAVLLSFPGRFQSSLRFSALVSLLVDLSFLLYFQLQPLRQRVDHRDSDTVESARNLVS